MHQEPESKELTVEKTQAIAKQEEETKKKEEQARLDNEKAQAMRELSVLLEQHQMVLGEPLFDVSGYLLNS